MNGFFTLRDLILLQVRKDLAAGLSLKEHSPIVAQFDGHYHKGHRHWSSYLPS
jgi:hypothetical protein